MDQVFKHNQNPVIPRTQFKMKMLYSNTYTMNFKAINDVNKTFNAL